MNRLQNFDQTIDHKQTNLYRLTNKNGVEAQITNFGAALVALLFPDKNGVTRDVVLGFDHVGDYQQDAAFHGIIAGRYANRIANASFEIDGKQYNLPANDGENTLHGGVKGFGKMVWDAEQHNNQLVLRYLSKDGEQGFPGNLSVEVRYELLDNNDLVIDYEASTDAETYVNLTNHAYFNLGGHKHGNIEKHVLKLNADLVTAKREDGIPTGELMPVANTPLDFTKPKEIGRDIQASHPQMDVGTGYDHNFVVNGSDEAMNAVAQVFLPDTGICLDVLSTMPGVQFYTGDHLKDGPVGKEGQVYTARNGFCLESQFFPDGPHHPGFPNTLLKPGDFYRHRTIYRLSIW